ncbi:MAG: NAD(P)H-dependent oxidoreductase subunit E [Opitutales bacterium]|nr:NAD(P)H-dependent oxidoreductase subunit E [Opitutales bacterium]
MEAATLPPLEEMDETTRDEIETSVAKWKDAEGNLIMILHEIQNRHGYVPRASSLLLAREMNIPLARIYEVLTFYHYFRLVPQGDHNITVCNGTACYLKGSGRLLSELEKQLGIKDGETTEDRMFHLETVRCIGCCGMAPALVVDKKTIGKNSPMDIPPILEKIRQQEKTHEDQ